MKLNGKPLLQMTVALAALALFVFAVPGYSSAVIDFATGEGTGGSLTITGTSIVGTNIPIDLVTIGGAPLNNGTFEVTGTGGDTADANGSGVLNFTCAGTTQTNCSTTNTITITGSIPTLAGFTLGTNVTLLSGTFSSIGSVTANASETAIGAATGLDTKNAQLLSDLGLSGTTFDFFGFSTDFLGTGVTSTDVGNSPVPEPSSLLLLGSGLLGFAALARRKLGAGRKVLVDRPV